MKYITRTVWMLSLVSLFTDMASEMLYPVMPAYLQSIGFSVVLIGVLEGLAETTAGLSKGFFGKWSDQLGRRLPFVQLGYALSAISKPIMGLFGSAFPVFVARTTDRLGKGIRTGARDALLSAETTTATKASVFGFHRSMDTLGAVIGPALALVWLWWRPGQYQTLFFIAFIPGLLAIAATALLKEKRTIAKPNQSVPTFLSFIKYWKQSPQPYRKLVTGLLLFALLNSSDIFLLMQAKANGISDTMVIGLYIFYNMVYALFAFPVGIVADKLGLKKMFVAGLILFGVVYLGFSFHHNTIGLGLLFLLYGIYAATTEGISKAWITNLVPAGNTGTAIGTYTAFQSLYAFLSSSLAGLVWYQWGASVLFYFTGIGTMVLAVFFATIIKENKV